MTQSETAASTVPDAAQAEFDAGAREFVAGNTDLAIEHLAASVRAHPDFDSALYLLALAHARSGDADAARRELERVVEITTNSMLRDMARGKLASLRTD